MTRKHPFVFAAFFWAYVAGILVAFYLVPPFTVACSLLALSFGTTVFTQRYLPVFFQKSLLLICCCMGIMLTRMHEEHRTFLHAQLEQPTKIIGTIYDRAQDQSKPWHTQLSLAVNQINDQSVHGAHLKITTSSRTPCIPGDTISLTLKAQKKLHADDFDTYVAKEGFIAWVFAGSHEVSILNSPPRSWHRFLYAARQKIAAAYQQLSVTSKALYVTLFLGEKAFSPLDPLKEAFNRWGIMHYLARSGLHITLFVFLWNYLLQLCRVSLRIRRYVIVPSVTVYAFLTPISTSFLRGLLICGLTLGAYFLRRPYLMKHLLCLAAFGILLYSPLQLFFLDFQLSFGLTYALTCIAAGLHQAKKASSTA